VVLYKRWGPGDYGLIPAEGQSLRPPLYSGGLFYYLGGEIRWKG